MLAGQRGIVEVATVPAVLAWAYRAMAGYHAERTPSEWRRLLLPNRTLWTLIASWSSLNCYERVIKHEEE